MDYTDFFNSEHTEEAQEKIYPEEPAAATEEALVVSESLPVSLADPDLPGEESEAESTVPFRRPERRKYHSSLQPASLYRHKISIVPIKFIHALSGAVCAVPQTIYSIKEDEEGDPKGKMVVLLKLSSADFRLLSGGDVLDRQVRQQSTVIQASVYELLYDNIPDVIDTVYSLQFKNPHYVDSARSVYHLISCLGLSQKEVAAWLGCNQSTIANKLRLLQLTDKVLDDSKNLGLSERHCRCLIAIDGEVMQLYVISKIQRDFISAQKLESLVKCLKGKTVSSIGLERYKQIIDEAFVNTHALYSKEIKNFIGILNDGITSLRKCGIVVFVSQTERENSKDITIRFPKKENGFNTRDQDK